MTDLDRLEVAAQTAAPMFERRQASAREALSLIKARDAFWALARPSTVLALIADLRRKDAALRRLVDMHDAGASSAAVLGYAWNEARAALEPKP